MFHGEGADVADSYVIGAVRFCHNPKFQQFLECKLSAPVVDKESAAGGLRQLCGIASRSELATNESAREAYRALIGEFSRYMKGGRL